LHGKKGVRGGREQKTGMSGKNTRLTGHGLWGKHGEANLLKKDNLEDPNAQKKL